MSSNAQKIGFIGLGIMGAPMAAHLLEAGHDLFVHTRGKAPEPFASHAMVCPTGPEVTVISILQNDSIKTIYRQNVASKAVHRSQSNINVRSTDPAIL